MKRIFPITAAAAGILFLILCVLVCRRANRVPDVFGRGQVTMKFDCPIPAADEEALTLLKGYFSLRCGSFARAARIKDEADGADSGLALSETVKSSENARVQKLRRLQKTWKCRFSGANADLRVDGWKEEDGAVVCLLYEFQWFRSWYAGYTSPETADVSGYGTRHVLLLKRLPDGGAELSADDYDEGRPTFAASGDRLSSADYAAYAGVPSEKREISGISLLEKLFPKESPVLPADPAAFPPSYRPDDAAAYADAWTAGYNTGRYPDLAPLGGDCCNFTSQCLYAGGMPLTEDWTPHGREAGSPAWISCSRLYALLTGKSGRAAVGKGIAVIRTDDAAGRYVRLGGRRRPASDVFYKGSPVFYCWGGEYENAGWWNHVALCVGVMGDGTPAVDCHTADKYHMKWNYGGTGCDYGAVQLTLTK